MTVTRVTCGAIFLSISGIFPLMVLPGRASYRYALLTVGLLRACRKRPGHHSAAEKGNELATPHSITSSAVESTVDGMVIPSAFAALRLMTSSNLVGTCTGRSPG